MSEIKSLTSLRGAFAIWVVFFHLQARSEFAHQPIPLIDRGYLGVDFFFLLSGFILASRHGCEFNGSYRLRTYTAFFLRRFGRIFPLHLIVLAAVVIIMYLRNEPQYWWTHIATEGALMHRWGLIHTPKGALNGPDWSISTEWAANLLFPGFVVVTGIATNSKILAAAFSVTAFLVLVLIETLSGSMDIAAANSYFPLLRCFAEFGLGMILFHRKNIFLPISGNILIITLAIGFLVGVFFHWDLVAVAIMLPLIPTLALNTGICSRFLSYDIFHKVGLVSYSIYLVQTPIILQIDEIAKGSSLAEAIHWGAIPPTILLFAICAYRFIENPANQWIKSLSEAIVVRTPRAELERDDSRYSVRNG